MPLSRSSTSSSPCAGGSCCSRASTPSRTVSNKKRKLAKTNEKRMKQAKLAAGAIEERAKEIKKLNGAVPIFSRQACSAWRAQYEGTNPVPAVSDGEGGEGGEDDEGND